MDHYIAAMDYKVDTIEHGRESQISPDLMDHEDVISEMDYDFFMDDNNRDMTATSVFTELDSLPLLIRRSSSKRRTDNWTGDKENSLSRESSLSRRFSILRMNSVSSEKSKFRNSFRTVCRALQAMEIPHSCSLENSLVLLRSEADSTVKEAVSWKDDASNHVKATDRKSCDLLEQEEESSTIPKENSLQCANDQVHDKANVKSPLQHANKIQEKDCSGEMSQTEENFGITVLNRDFPSEECNNAVESETSSAVQRNEQNKESPSSSSNQESDQMISILRNVSPEQNNTLLDGPVSILSQKGNEYLKSYCKEKVQLPGVVDEILKDWADEELPNKEYDQRIRASIDQSPEQTNNSDAPETTILKKGNEQWGPNYKAKEQSEEVLSEILKDWNEDEFEEVEVPELRRESYFQKTNPSSVRNDGHLQMTPMAGEKRSKRSRSPSPDEEVKKTKQSNPAVNETAEKEEVKNTDFQIRKEDYEQTALDSTCEPENKNITLTSFPKDVNQSSYSHSVAKYEQDTHKEKQNNLECNQHNINRPSKRSRSPASGSPSLKKSRREIQTTKKMTIITRASTNKFTRKSPNHSTHNISQKKVQIFKAAEKGDLRLVMDLLHHTGPTIRNAKTNCTLLHTAAANNEKDVLLYLLDFISPNMVNNEEQTPAHLAAKAGHTNILKILLSDKEFNPNKFDKEQKTFKDLLVGPLFEAVLAGDKNKTVTLLELGANPDDHVGDLAEGVLTRELRVTTPRQLATSLHREQLLRLFPKQCASRFMMTSENKHWNVPDSQMIKSGHSGYFCVLNFKSFIKRPDLGRKNSTVGIDGLSRLLREKGYKGDIHNSLTAEGTKQAIKTIVNSQELDKAQSAIFIISSHSADRESFLTSDLKVLKTEWLMNSFRNSECPNLRNKPKLFIFDFDSGYYMENLHLPSEEKSVRVQESLSDMIGLYYSDNALTKKVSSFTFIKSLCRTLRLHGDEKDITYIHKELLKDCMKKGFCSFPELRSYGVSGGFYLGL